jgi:predicted NBD/HSP70 family sugar kinase
VSYYAGLDVSLEETSICIVDDAGRVVREARVASEPETLVAFFGARGIAQIMHRSSPECAAQLIRRSSPRGAAAPNAGATPASSC